MTVTDTSQHYQGQAAVMTFWCLYVFVIVRVRRVALANGTSTYLPASPHRPLHSAMSLGPAVETTYDMGASWLAHKSAAAAAADSGES